MNQSTNKQVAVTSYYFSGKTARCYPKRVELEDGEELNFIESGLRCLVKTGQGIVQIFSMTDGNRQYRLRFEPENKLWTLLGVRVLG